MKLRINLFKDGVIHPASRTYINHKVLSNWERYHRPMIVDLPDLLITVDEENALGTVMQEVKKWIIENNPYYETMNPLDTVVVNDIDFFPNYGRGRIRYYRRSKKGTDMCVCTTSYFTINYES